MVRSAARASRTMRPRLWPSSFETLAAQAPQDAGLDDVTSKTDGDPAIDIERVAVDEGRRLAGQEHGRTDQFLDIAPAGGRRPLFQPGRKFRVVDQRLVERGLEIAR